MKYIASVSWGKDSLAMLLVILEKRLPLDEVVFFDTGMEFDCIYEVSHCMGERLRSLGIKYTILKPPFPFEYYMFDKPVRSRDGSFHNGYCWCGGVCRWGTSLKTSALDKYCYDAAVYVGIASDEKPRIPLQMKKGHLLPLVDFGIDESTALSLCYSSGFTYEIGNVRLYDVLDRVSCWCCRNKNLKELKNIHDFLPSLFTRLVAMEERLGVPMKPPLTLSERFG